MAYNEGVCAYAPQFIIILQTKNLDESSDLHLDKLHLPIILLLIFFALDYKNFQAGDVLIDSIKKNTQKK